MSEKLEPRADKLTFNVSSQEKNFCDCFVYEPVNAAEERLGNAYMIGELKDVSEDSFFVLNHISTLFKRNYYSNTQKPCITAFEDALKKVNEGMQELASDKKAEWVGKLHFAIGVLSQNTFYFSVCGTPRIFFLRHGETTDVGEKMSTGLKDNSPNKIFKNVASGRVEKDDKVLMLTAETFQAIPKDLWREITTSQNQAKKIRELSSSQRLNFSHTGGILIVSFARNEIHEARETIPMFPLDQQTSRTPRQTQFMRKSGFRSFLKTSKTILKFIYVLLRFIAKSLIFILGKLLFLLERLLGMLWTQLKKIRFFRNLEDGLRAIPQKSFIQNTKKFFSFFRKKIVYIPLIIILISLCGVSGFFYQKREAKISQWRITLDQAKEKYKEGEISLIYGAKEKSIASFGEASSLVSKLEASGYLKKETKDLKESTLAKLQKLLNIVVIEKPEVLTTLGNFSIKFDPQRIAMTQDESLIFASDSSSALFYKFSIEDRKGEFALAPISEGGVSKAERIDNITLFFAQPKSVFFYIPNEGRFNDSQILNLPYEDFLFNDFATCKNSIFLLDSKNGEIVKLNYRKDSLDDPVTSGIIWLKRTTKKPLEARSIACDTNPWIISQAGAIQKYSGGVFIQELKTSLPFANPVKIWTSPEQTSLFILDSQNKNLTILDKKGQVQKQFFSEKFNDLKDFWISQSGKEIYLLNGNQIFIVKNEE